MIPQYLRDIPNWIGVRVEQQNDGKLKKTPVDPRTGCAVDATDPAHGLPFEEAHEAAISNGLDGLAFILTKEAGVTVADIDHCRETQGGRYKDYAYDIVNQLDSYTELSISGTGLHVFLRGNLPDDINIRKNDKLELFNSKHCIVVTGNRLRPTKRGKWKQNLSHDIERRQEELDELYQKEFPGQRPAPRPGCLVDPTDTYIEPRQLNRLLQVPQAREIYEGRWAGFPSQSEADFCLCHLAVAQGWDNPQQLCALIVQARASAGAKEKPNLADYCARTIAKASAIDVRERTLEDAMSIVREYLHIEDPNLLAVILGVVAANYPGGDPVWLFLVAPPSSGKTALLQALHGHESVKPLSDLTTKAGVSGYGLEDPNAADHSLFKQLGGKTLLIKDYTLQVVKNEQERAEIEGQLRDIYDGEANKFFGTGERTVYATFNVLAGVTNVIEDTYENASLGERFLRYCTDIPNPNAAALLAIESANDHDRDPRRKVAIAEAVLGVLKHAAKQPIPDVPKRLWKRIAQLAMILGTVRTHVDRDKGDHVKRTPDPEGPPRVARQFVRLAKGIACVRSKAVADEEEMRILYKISLDSTTELRRRVFQLLASQDREFELNEIKTAMGHLALCNTLEDLTVLGIATKRVEKRDAKVESGNGRKGNVPVRVYYYRLSDKFRNLVYNSGMVPRPSAKPSAKRKPRTRQGAKSAK